MCLYQLWFSGDICSGVGLRDHKVTLCVVFQETSILCSLAPVTHFQYRVGVFHYPQLCPAFFFIILLHNSSSDWGQLTMELWYFGVVCLFVHLFVFNEG